MSPIDTRHSERDSLFLITELVCEAGEPPVRIKVRNLSTDGMMVEGNLRLRRGMRVAAELRNIGPVAGTVVWVLGRRIGVAFDAPIDPKLARIQVQSGDREALVYARATVEAPKHDGWNGKLRRI